MLAEFLFLQEICPLDADSDPGGKFDADPDPKYWQQLKTPII